MSKALEIIRQFVVTESVLEMTNKGDRTNGIDKSDGAEREEHCSVIADAQKQSKTTGHNGPHNALLRNA